MIALREDDAESFRLPAQVAANLAALSVQDRQQLGFQRNMRLLSKVVYFLYKMS
jgi:hypothetical protein